MSTSSENSPGAGSIVSYAPPMHRSIKTLGHELRSRQTTAQELLKQALNNDRHGAYKTIDRERSERAAKAADALFDAGIDLGPLQGLPISVKDLYGVPGYPTFAGSPKQLPAKFEQAGPVVQQLLKAGAVITGKTHTVELAFGGLGANAHHPPPQNPHDRARVAGGSSSGAGVSLTEGSSVLALGTDTAGSVRIPASYTGNVALKTTFGRWSREGIVPLSSTLDTAGVLARTIEDLIAGFTAFDREPVPPVPALRTCRFARMDALFFEGCAPGINEAIDRAIATIEEHGARVDGVTWPEVQEAHGIFSLGGPAAVELYEFLSRELPEWRETLDPNIAARVISAHETPAVEYVRRVGVMMRAAASIDQRFEHVDALLAPTVANTPPRFDAIEKPDDYRRENILALRNTAVGSYLGLCAITLPAGKDAAGMPVGLQLIGRARSEARLLAIAAAIEEALAEPMGKRR